MAQTNVTNGHHAPKNVDDPIIITGMAGLFPDSYNVFDFGEKLYNKVDLVSPDESRRWKSNHPEVPKKGGRIYNIDQFDPGFFGISYKQACASDPMLRLTLERVIEAIIDAGYNPEEFSGTNTGVFVGACFAETEVWFFHKLIPNYPSITGTTRSMISHRISYFLKLTGPSFVLDTACSSSLYAVETAYKSIKNGLCDQAIICGLNLNLHPFTTLHFKRLGVLSDDGNCKVFDDRANGYARSESINCLILQKSGVARRSYARIIHAKTNCDGYKPHGITFPSSEAQIQLLNETYSEANVDPRSISYLEAHGTGTQVGDPEELLAINQVFCKNRGDTLLVGSVKSNIGHSEPASGINSIVKVLLGTEQNRILPNINFSTPRKGIEAFENNTLKVVIEPTEFRSDRRLIGVNSFGFGGGNAHVILNADKISTKTPNDGLPRLICASGRIREAAPTILDAFNVYNPEHAALYHKIFAKNIPGHHYRGYSILTRNNVEIARSVKFLGIDEKPLCLIFSSFGEQWPVVNQSFIHCSNYARTLKNVENILMKAKLGCLNLMDGRETFNRILGNGVVLLGLAEILRKIGIKPKVFFGYSIFGEIVCGYYKNDYGLKEAVIAIYHLALFTEKLFKAQSTINRDQLYEFLHQFLPKNKFCSLRTKMQISLKTLNCNDKMHKFFDGLDGNSVVFEIGNCMDPKVSNLKLIQMVEENSNDCFVEFLQSLGSVYESGLNFDLTELYPKVEFPVSTGTPMMSHLIKWYHKETFFEELYSINQIKQGEYFYVINFKEDPWKVDGHVIDGHILFPATGYLIVALKGFTHQFGLLYDKCRVLIQNVRFLRALPLSKKNMYNLFFNIHQGSGEFIIGCDQNILVTGKINFLKSSPKKIPYDRMDQNFDQTEECVMETKDIYRELRLRGYHYKGDFMKLLEYNFLTNTGIVQWKNNWVAFMDNLLQVSILNYDTRLLYVPTGIREIVIDGEAHLEFLQKYGDEDQKVPVYMNRYSKMIRCGGISMKGLHVTAIATRKPRGEPVLESYQFIPNIAKMKLKDALKVNIQIILENLPTVDVKAAEIDDYQHDDNYLSPMILEVLEDLPLINPNITLITTKTIELPGITIDTKQIEQQDDYLLIIGSKFLESPENYDFIQPNTFILSREHKNIPCDVTNIDIITQYDVGDEILVLFQKSKEYSLPKVVELFGEDYEWLPKLQRALKETKEVLVVAQQQPMSGILGFVNCLRREPYCSQVRCVFIMDDDAPSFQLCPFYLEQLKKNLAVNVWKNGEWGTYRHLTLDEVKVKADHMFVNLRKGDLSTLRWYEGPLTRDDMPENEMELVEVHYSALNFRDIMLATGKIQSDSVTMDRVKQEAVVGFEIAGVTRSGRRVMGMVPECGLSTLSKVLQPTLFTIPADWSFEDGATVTVVYSTIIRSLIEIAKIRPKQSILIHSGTGGIGIAAITLAFYYDCEVFTTCGTEEKRQFLLNYFPKLKDDHIGNSRDLSFEKMIKVMTNQRGVDIVLNSLAGEKLITSVRCLAKGGKFLEIGKYDIANDSKLELMILEKEASFHGIMVDQDYNDIFKLKRVGEIFKQLLGTVIKPLPRTVFEMDDIEKAFRFMATGKHIGKVLIKIKETPEQPLKIQECHPRYCCNETKVYVILGGLGGFGLELADWLILRGAQKIILNSRNGVRTGYQAYRINLWRAQGREIIISTDDITTKDGCESLLIMANNLGTVAVIFNLAVVLKDAIFENQSVEMFQISAKPKSVATFYLDQVSRELCPKLEDFVVFSSVSCGRGNAGQTNYGLANSIMERICEKRRQDGLPGLAIQWGAIGDVGLVANMMDEHVQLEIGGTLQQRISSCLQVLDGLLKQPHAIVASMVVAEKRRRFAADNLIDIIANILGISDIKTVSPHTSFPELGMDSMSAVEIKQILEREFEIFLTPDDLRSLTFAKLTEIQENKQSDENLEERGFELLQTIIQDEKTARQPIIDLKSKIGDPGVHAPKVFLFAGIDGCSKLLISLCEHLEAVTKCLQYDYRSEIGLVHKIAEKQFEILEPLLKKDERFVLIAYSYGVIVALEVASMLERIGYVGTIICIDCSPFVAPVYFKNFKEAEVETAVQMQILVSSLRQVMSNKIVNDNKVRLLKCSTLDERLKIAAELVPKDSPYDVRYLRQLVKACYYRMIGLLHYLPQYPKLKSNVKLFKPTIVSFGIVEPDYKLSSICEKKVEIQVFEGDHKTILENTNMADEINRILATI